MSQIQKIEQFRYELAIAETYEDIKVLDAKVSAIAEFARRSKVTKIKQDELGEFRVEIEVKKGAWLDEFFPHGNEKGINNRESVSFNSSSLQDIGIGYNESANAKLLKNEPELRNEIISQIKEDDNLIVSPYSVQRLIRQRKKNVHISYNSNNNEWYTPLQYIESARTVMGCIDLDPASSDIVNEKVKASHIFTKDTNGLNHKWFGNVWLNPPYESGLVDDFVNKVCEKEYEQIIILVNNATETKWGNKLLNISNCVCFHKSRIKFLPTYGNDSNSPLQGQMIIYIGNSVMKFINEFKKYGVCLSVVK